MQVGAARCNEAENIGGMAMSREDPVVTVFEGTPCMTRPLDAVVSERGLEPPRPKRALDPQPSASTNSATPTCAAPEYTGVGVRPGRVHSSKTHQSAAVARTPPGSALC